jgi:ubiquinone/menaquinone biosynthesis C-methylase UbiE
MEPEEKIKDENLEEMEYWAKYSDFMTGKNRDPYINSPYFQTELKKISEFISPQEGQKWLDLGCGALPIAELFLKKAEGKDLEIWAGDVNLKPAKKKLEELGNPPIKLRHIDVTEKMPFPNDFFDGIVASKVLTFIPKAHGKEGKEGLREIFKELFRILKPGSVLVWTTTQKGVSSLKGILLGLGYVLNPYQWLKQKSFLPVFTYQLNNVFKPVVEKVHTGVYPVLNSREEYEEMLEKIGFKNPEWKTTAGFQVLVNRVDKPL